MIYQIFIDVSKVLIKSQVFELVKIYKGPFSPYSPLMKQEIQKSIDLPSSWLEHLQVEFQKDYMIHLRSFLLQESKKGKVIYPHGKNIFSALKLAPLDRVKVVIIGQDPYHGPNQAHGLCFSVRPGVPIPPSLKNIYKELANDINFQAPPHGFLESWARQGVLMLNNVLTVEKGRAASHKGKGWELFTDRIVDILNTQKENLVFLLWGRDAKTKAMAVDRQRHFVLESAHPSPFSATRFFGNHHFSRCNQYLRERGLEEIDWQLPMHIHQ